MIGVKRQSPRSWLLKMCRNSPSLAMLTMRVYRTIFIFTSLKNRRRPGVTAICLTLTSTGDDPALTMRIRTSRRTVNVRATNDALCLPASENHRERSGR